MSTRNTIVEWVWVILLSAAFSLGVRVYAAEARWIPSESMTPTLMARFWGFLPKERVIGRAFFRFYPLSRAGSIE